MSNMTTDTVATYQLRRDDLMDYLKSLFPAESHRIKIEVGNPDIQVIRELTIGTR
jgi:hypothetical protein